jgi:hypothetical protein
VAAVIPKVFISSTARDLEAYRDAAREECVHVGLLPLDMKFFEAMAKGATEGSKQKLDEADLYLGIFAHRYGYVEEGYPASVTECEYDYAAERGLDRLCFLVQDDHPVGEILEDDATLERLRTFKQRITQKHICSWFTTVEDFRGKVRLALANWKAGDARARLPQPTLTTNVVEPSHANRLTYRARQTPFVGRRDEWKALERFLEDEAELSWLVVCGPGGSGKSRLAQEFCLSVGPSRSERSSEGGWRAGFLAAGHTFDWATWQPNADTLIAVDYAAERVDEIRAVLSGCFARKKDGASSRVRLLLVERDANGDWLRQVAGSRSDGYAIEQFRCRESPVTLPALSSDELWDTVHGALKGSHGLPQRADVLQRLQEIDPDGRPLYAALTADALLSGRDIREWDRERLLRDVLERERQAWKNSGVDERYENLLALATLVGGDTEAILQNGAGPGLALPSFREFDRGVYGAMTACAPEGNDVPAMKPDLVGEFFVLEHLRGRNERVTALNAAEFLNAAWTIRGGSKSSDYFGIGKYITPSTLILFITQLVDDFPDHPSTRHLLRKPDVPSADLRYWATMVALGVRRYAIRGDFAAGYALFQELTALGTEERRRAGGVAGSIRAGLYLLPLLLQQKEDSEARDVLRGVQDMVTHENAQPEDRYAFAEAAQESTILLLPSHVATVETLIEHQAALIRQYPDQQDLRLPYAQTLSLTVSAKWLELSYREQVFARLKDFCRSHAEDVLMYVTVAKGALALFDEYVKVVDRLGDAESMNNLIRSLHKGRGRQTVSRFRDPMNPLSAEAATADLREIALCLAESNAGLVGPWTRAERFGDASDLIGAIEQISRPYRNDVEFARRWCWAVVFDAEVRAEQGALVQVSKAVTALGEVATHYRDHAAEFRAYGSQLALAVMRKKMDIATATEMLPLLAESANAGDAGPETIADYAQGAITMCKLQEAQERWPESRTTAREAAWAIRSEAYLARLRERGIDETHIQRLIEGLGTPEVAGQG